MSCGGKTLGIVCAVISTLWSFTCPFPASAGITPWGDMDPAYDGTDPWNVAGDLLVGIDTSASLSITGGSQLSSQNAYLGRSTGIWGLVAVTEPGSAWVNSGDFHIGEAGQGTLSIFNQSYVSGSTAFVGGLATSESALSVSGESVLELGGPLYVGVNGKGSFDVSYASRAKSNGAVLATEAGSEGIVQVVLPNSRWETGPYLDIGGSGDAVMLVHHGARVIDTVGRVAVQAGSTGRVAVQGYGSSGAFWDNSGELIIGMGGDASLVISERGEVTSASGHIAQFAGSVGTVTTTDANSLWRNSGRLDIGGSGDANMVISNGGHLLSLATIVGAESGGRGIVTVSGPGSRLTAVNLNVGDYGQGSLTVVDGGHVWALHTIVGAWSGGSGSAAVTGPDSVWDNVGILDVGYQGDGQLTISDGARVTSATGKIGSFVGGAGVVTLSGAGSVWTNTNTLYVGGNETEAAGAGTLVLGEGTTVESDSVRIWSTGVLTGDGTLRGDVVNHGIIRPGNSIGTLTVDGDLSLDSGSTLEVEIDNAGNSDKLIVTGTFKPGLGHVRPVAAETIVGEHQYVVVEAGSVSWPQLAVIDQFDTALLRSFITPDPLEQNTVLMHVLAIAYDNPGIALTNNQRSLGSALQHIAEGGGSEVTMGLQQLLTLDEVRQAYNQLSGQTTPSLAPVTVAGGTRQVGMISGRLRSAADGFAHDAGLGQSSDRLVSGMDSVGVDAGRYLFAVGNGSPVLGEKPWGVWGKGYGLYGDRETESGVPGYQYTVYGAGFGVDYRFTDQVFLGLTGGYSEGDIDYSGLRDSSDVSATHRGLYGSYETSLWYLDSILTYADLDYETRRFVDLTGERLEGDPSGDLLTGYLEAGLNLWRAGGTFIQPLAAFQFSTLRIDSFTETGGASALTFDDERYESYKGSLGVKLTRQLFAHDDGRRATVELRGRWVHEFGDTQATFDAAFASDPGVVFRVSDGDIARDSAVLGAGLDTWFTRRTRAFVDYATELNPDNTIHLVSAGLEHRW